MSCAPAGFRSPRAFEFDTPKPPANVMGRDLAGRNTGVSIAGGASVARSFDAMGRLITQETTSPAGTVEARSYVYDWRGRVESVGVSIAGFPTEDVEYAYTVEGWLTEEARTSYAGSSPVTTVRAHSYDDAGNRLTTSTDGVVDHTWTYDEGNLAATMDGLAYGFNPQAELEEDPRGYSLLRAPDGVEVEIADPASGLAYSIARDPGGNPVGVYDGVTERIQTWGNPELDQPLVVDEVSGTTAEIVVGIEGLQIGRKAPSGAFTAAVTDALGSLVLDGNTLVGVPEAFGVGASPAAGSMQRHVYAGLESLPGTPYQLARARVMDPTAGRFVSADPTGLDGGDHRFIYAESQPTGFVERARAKGKHLGRPRVALDVRPAVAMMEKGYGLKSVAKALGVPRSTLRRHLAEAGVHKGLAAASA